MKLYIRVDDDALQLPVASPDEARRLIESARDQWQQLATDAISGLIVLENEAGNIIAFDFGRAKVIKLVGVAL